jgi:hypothetical protein
MWNFKTALAMVSAFALLVSCNKFEFNARTANVSDGGNFSLVRSLGLELDAPDNSSLQVLKTSDGLIQLSSYQFLSGSTLPGFNYGHAVDMTYDSTHHLLYVAQYSFYSAPSISIISTKGTETVLDDEVVGYYDSTTTPAIGTSQIYDVHLVPETGVLYVSFRSHGVYAIDTKKNADPSDDTLLHHYLHGAIPGLNHVNNYAHRVTHTEDGLLLFSTYGGGLRVFDTKNTTSVADDTLLINYTNASAPNIGTPWMWDAHYSSSLGAIFVGTNTGIHVIGTNGTPFNLADDSKLGVYSTASGIALTNNRIVRVFYDDASGLLYAASDSWEGTDTNSVTIIDTKKTASLADDTLYAQYTQVDLGFAGLMRTRDFYVDSAKNTLYLSVTSGTKQGLFQIDTKGTPTKDDDIIKHYTRNNGLIDSYIRSAIYVPELNSLFAGAYGGITVFTDNFQNLAGTYVMRTYESSLWAEHQIIQWTAATPAGTSISAKVRNANASFKADFSDGDVSDVTDAYAWNSFFPSVFESDGILTLTGSPAEATWAAIWFETGQSDDFYPAGSYVEVKLRVTTSASAYGDCLFVDEYETSTTCFEPTGDWQIVSLTPNTPFSRIGLQPWWDSGTWQPTDKIEIEYVRVFAPGAWTPWRPLTNRARNAEGHDRSYDFFQVAFDLTSDSAGKTPALMSVDILE